MSDQNTQSAHDELHHASRLDIAALILIVISLALLSIETLPHLSADQRRWLFRAEVVVTVLFTIEYIIRVLQAERKRDYIFSFYGMVDLLAIAPFYLSLGLGLQPLRAVRIFQLLRILKLTRYSMAVQRLGKALTMVREEIVLYGIATVIILYFASFGIYYFEHDAQPENFASVFHSLWWAVSTLTTVGYGDVYPITTGGRIFTFLVLMLGLGVVAVPAGLLSSALAKVRSDEQQTALDERSESD